MIKLMLEEPNNKKNRRVNEDKFMADVQRYEYVDLETIDLAENRADKEDYLEWCDDGIRACEILMDAYSDDTKYLYQDEPITDTLIYELLEYAHEALNYLYNFKFREAETAASKYIKRFDASFDRNNRKFIEDKEVVNLIKSQVDVSDGVVYDALVTLARVGEFNGLKKYFEYDFQQEDLNIYDDTADASLYSYKGQPLSVYEDIYEFLYLLETLSLYERDYFNMSY